MPSGLILASASPIRRELLHRSGLRFAVETARVDEEATKDALLAEGATIRDVADALAEAKARRVAGRHPGHMVIGADQTLEFEGRLLSKPGSRDEAERQLALLAGRRHRLHAAAVVFEEARPVWRHVASATLVMRPLSPGFVARYLDRNWESVRGSVGAYKIEEEAPRLFSAIEGSYFAILGLPLLELLSYLIEREVLEA